MGKTRSLIAGLVALVSSGCVGMYHEDTFNLPPKTNCTTVARFNPVNKLYMIPYSMGVSIAANAVHAVQTGIDGGCIGPITGPISFVEGMLNVTTDTAINIVAWPCVEVYEAVKGQTWDGFYLPYTRAMMEQADFHRKVNGIMNYNR